MDSEEKFQVPEEPQQTVPEEPIHQMLPCDFIPAVGQVKVPRNKADSLTRLYSDETIFFLKKVCSIAWHWLLSEGNCNPPKIFNDVYIPLKNLHIEHNARYSQNHFAEDFNSYWQKMSWCQLWDVLFTDCGVEECLQIILKYPFEVTCSPKIVSV